MQRAMQSLICDHLGQPGLSCCGTNAARRHAPLVEETGEKRDSSSAYTSREFLLQELRGDAVRLVRPQYLISLCEQRSQPLPCRQDLPEEAFLDLADLSEEAQQQLVVIAVSYCWLTRDHADPEGYHLTTLQALIQCYLSGSHAGDEDERRMLQEDGFYLGGKDHPVGIFFDWASLYQDKPKPRTAEQSALFKRALKRINLWYAHQASIVWMLTSQSQGAAPRASYDDSGWPFFERTVSGIIKPAPRLLCVGEEARRELLTSKPRDYVALTKKLMDTQRGPPLHPKSFNGLVQAKTFTNAADVGQVVIPKYLKTFDEVIAAAESLNLLNTGLDKHTGRELLQVLSQHCPGLRDLNLRGNSRLQMSLGELALGLQGLDQLVQLDLSACPGIWGDVSSLAPLAHLRRLDLWGCSGLTGDLSGLAPLVNLTKLWLSDCPGVTGDLAGLAPLVGLTELWLSECPSIGGDLSGLAALVNLSALHLSKCPGLTGQVSALAPLVHLTRLDLSGCSGLAGEVSGLATLRELTRLNLSGCAGVTGDLLTLAPLVCLKTLDLNDCAVVTSAIPDFSFIPSASA